MFCSKKKWSQGTEKRFIECWKRSAMHAFTLFVLLQPGEEFLCQGNSSPDEILAVCLAQENQEMYP
jgi:hypothetical protein